MMPKPEVIFLGTNGWFDTATGNTICTLLKAKDVNILLDAGIGIYKFDQYASLDKPLFIFLSHFHLDHLFGLHIFNKFKFKKTVNIIVPKGMRKHLLKLVNHPFTIPFSGLPFKVLIKEVAAEEELILPFFKVKPFLLRHSGSSYGYRFIFGKKIIAYCPDTGYCKNAIRLAENADLLIAESSLLTNPDSAKWGHLLPEDAALIAKKAKAKKLALTHFDAAVYKSFYDRIKANKRAVSVFKDTVSAKDGLKILV